MDEIASQKDFAIILNKNTRGPHETQAWLKAEVQIAIGIESC